MRLLVGQSGRMWLRRFARRTASGCVSWCMVFFVFLFGVSSNQVVWLPGGWVPPVCVVFFCALTR